MVLKNSGLSSGSESSLKIYKKGIFGETQLASIKSNIDSDGNLETSWNVEQKNIAGVRNDPSNIYFDALDPLGNKIAQSNSLTMMLNITSCDEVYACGSYTTKDACMIDLCSVSVQSAGNVACETGKNCKGSWTRCSCMWDDSSQKCLSSFFEESCSGVVSRIGVCSISGGSNDSCSDTGFVKYSFGSAWIWDSINAFNESSGSDYVLGKDGKWHYDPLKKSEVCEENSGTKEIQCIGKVMLNFFSWYIFAIAVIVIAAIYILIAKRKGKGKKKNKGKRH